MDRDAMFVSIGKCREVLQERIPYIRRKELKDTAVELHAILYEIERRNPFGDQMILRS
jgi:hypothetical protein